MTMTGHDVDVRINPALTRHRELDGNIFIFFIWKYFHYYG